MCEWLEVVPWCKDGISMVVHLMMPKKKDSHFKILGVPLSPIGLGFVSLASCALVRLVINARPCVAQKRSRSSVDRQILLQRWRSMVVSEHLFHHEVSEGGKKR